MLVCGFLCAIARETAGAARTRPSLRPHRRGPTSDSKPRADRAARSRIIFSCHHPPRRGSSIPETVVMEIEMSRRTGSPPEPVIGGAFARPGGGEDGGYASLVPRHCERSEATHCHLAHGKMDCFAALATTRRSRSPSSRTLRWPRSGRLEGSSHHRRAERDCPRNRLETRTDRMSYFAMQQNHRRGPC